MTTKFGSSARSFSVLGAMRLLILALLSFVAGDHARAAGVVAAPPPISLTGSDGAGLELVSLTADAAIDDPLAFTELHLTFRNPENRVREGRFRITLPSGATISRFAMRIGERWQEGEVVEQQAARVAYEDFLHHKQDPALLEIEAGNEFSARVFPLPALATKEIVISYAQELTRAGEPYRLPLRGLPRLGTLAIRALNGKTQTRLERRDFTPSADFELAHQLPGGRLGLRDDNLVVARVVPLAETTTREEIGDLQLLVDTSASRALGLVEEAAAVERLLGELRKNGDPVITVVAFDQEVVPLWGGRASGATGTVARRIVARGALGASDLGRALASLAATINPVKGRPARVLLVTDGVATAGETGADKLRARVAALAGVGVRRLDVMAVGGIRDDVMLSRLVTAGLPQDGLVLDAEQAAPVIVGRLSRATRSGITIAVDGAGWVWPSVVNGVQPGDELLVYADLPPSVPFRLKVAGVPVTPAGVLAPTPRPLLERAWVRARIARLIEERDTVAAQDRDLAAALKKQAIDLSIQSRVLCPFTSLLVLETEQDYGRFGIERRALADILTVGPTGVTLLHRLEIAAPSAEAHWSAADDEALPAEARALAKGEAGNLGEEKAKKADARPTRDRVEREDSFDRGPAGAPVAAQAVAPPPSVRAMPEPSARALEDLASGAGASANVGGGRVHDEPTPMRALRPRSAMAVPAAVAAAEGAAIGAAPLAGPFKEVLELIQAGRARQALAHASAWRQHDAGDVLALVALGECFEALGDAPGASRAYGSIIDLFPGRADMRRFAGERLERVAGERPLALAIDSYRKAVEQRPDHPAGHHLLGFALLKAGHPREAFEAVVVGAAQKYPAGRFLGVDRILREDLGLLAAAWTHAEPARGAEIHERLLRAGGTPESGPSMRFILNWETDANDVDFHIHDARGGHAFFSAPHLPSGGELYADVTTGYGPECFTIRGSAAGRAAPYHLQAHYYSRGPMGYGMGKLQIIDHDGHGNLRFDERPFVIMQDGAFVDLGQVGATAVGARTVVRRVAPREVRDVGEAPQRRRARAEVDLGR